jgi:quercetin dioxygenase-like cupin family protein
MSSYSARRTNHSYECRGKRPQQIARIRLGAEPARVLCDRDDGRHAVVDRSDQFVGGHGDDAERPLPLAVLIAPVLPDASAGTSISKQRRRLMRATQCAFALVAGICTVMVSTASIAQDPPWRHEIRRLDVPGAPDKQIVVELNEFKPGDELDRHSHPGIEQGYVIQGAMVQQPGKDPIMFPTGTLLSNMPDVVHGGFEVVGDTSLKAFSVYVVDRNRPLYDWAK